jgi:hypothetical protein
MIPRICRFSSLFAATLFSLAVASPASAQSEVRGPFFDFFGARVQSTEGSDDFHTESYGVRGGFRFNRTWALEGSLSRIKDTDAWFGDVSAKAYFVHANRFEMYAVASPGLFRVSGENPQLTLHAGIGAEIGLTERVYLRPEVRGRWLAKELRGDNGLVDYSLGLGWRF